MTRGSTIASGIAGLLVALFVTVSATAGGPGEPPRERFSDANRAFAEGRYGDAAAAYEQVARDAGESPALLLNLGNARLRLEDHGRAIAAYERGLAIAPRDADLRANLRAARARAGLDVAEPSWLRAAGWLRVDEWAILLACAAAVAGLAVMLRSTRPNTAPRVVRGTLAVGLTMAVVAGAGLWVRAPVVDRAIVLEENVPMLVSPARGTEAVGELAAGSRVHLRKQHGDFVLVRDTGDRAGWVERDALAPVYRGS